MSNGNGTAALALALGAGSGLALWYLTRDDAPPKAGPSPTTPTPPTTPTAPSSTMAPATAPTPAPCQLRLMAAGLTADGQPIDVPGAVARCKAAGRAEVVITGDAPGAVYAQLAAALAEVGVAVAPRRNGRPVRHRSKRRQSASAANLDVADFAATVLRLADKVEEDPNAEGRARGRFGSRKVFIAAIRRLLRKTKYGRLPRATIDELFIAAMRKGLLDLVRADLVAAMDADEVADSEIQHDIATFHFMISERPEPWQPRMAR